MESTVTNEKEERHLSEEEAITSSDDESSDYESSVSELSEDDFDAPISTTIRKWVLQARIGKGSFGVVWKAIHSETNAIVALKIAKKNEDSTREVEVLSHMGPHPNVIELLDDFEHVTPQTWIHKISVFKLYHGDLFDFIELFEHNMVGIANAKHILVQILRGMKHMKDKDVVHSDLKLENILVSDMDTDTPTVAIADFGSAAMKNSKICLYGKTSHYRSPEIIVNMPGCMSPPTDVWSFACLAFELITGEALFDPKESLRDNYSSSSEEESSSSSQEESSSYDVSYEVNFEHLILMQEILGPFPRQFAKRARKYFNAKGKLMDNPEIYPSSLREALVDSGLGKENSVLVEAFLKPMLMYSIKRRATVEDLLAHPFVANAAIV